jgi:hypothetical protein
LKVQGQPGLHSKILKKKRDNGGSNWEVVAVVQARISGQILIRFDVKGRQRVM